MALADAKKLKGVVITASPGRMFKARRLSQSASVPDAQATEAAEPVKAATSRSKASVSAPKMNC
jgi:hypothetical protein